jgi:hypothetical protein
MRMSTKKQPEVGTRLVWRMTAAAPAGEYLDLEIVPKEAVDQTSTAALKRTLHPETPPSYRKVSIEPSARSEAPQRLDTAATSRPATTGPQTTPSHEQPPVDVPFLAVSRLKVLKPAQVESWQSSSFDLLTGCLVRDVTDTIPGKIFDELFKPGHEDLFAHAPRRRR